MIHTVKGFSIVSETEIDVFLKFPCFLYNPANVSNLISSFSSFSKPSLDNWKVLVHIMLKPSMQDFKYDLKLAWTLSAIVQPFKHSLVLPFLGIGMRIDLFQSYGWVFQICRHVECSTLMASLSRVFNSSTRIPSPPLSLFIVMLPMAYLTSYSRMSGSR